MKGGFCRMCGSKKLRRQESDIFTESQKKKLTAVSIWICENCGEEFLDDASREKVYGRSPLARSRKSLRPEKLLILCPTELLCVCMRAIAFSKKSL